MSEKSTFWKKTGLQDWFLPSEKTKTKQQVAKGLTPDEVYKYIIEKFKESVGQLSFANRIVFYHEYIICFNEEDYKEFLAHKQGLFGIIVHESVKQFYQLLEEYKAAGKTVEPSSSKWVFRLVSHPDYERGDKGFIGKLLPGSTKKDENLRVTFIPRQTGIAQTLDVNQDILNGFTYYSEGYYELPYTLEGGAAVANTGQAAGGKTYARLETIMPDQNFRGKKLEYLMKSNEILICQLFNQGFENIEGIDKFLPQEVDHGYGVKVMKKDLSDLKASSYDLIMMHHVLEHMDQQKEVLVDCRKLLKKTGCLMIRIPLIGEVWENYQNNWIQLDAPRHFFLHTLKSMEILAKQAGFEIRQTIFDSTGFQFWGSELYKKDIPLFSTGSSSNIYPIEKIFSKIELQAFERDAEQLNLAYRGDSAAFYLYKA